MKKGSAGNRANGISWAQHLGWLKRAFWKGERQAHKAALPERLSDDFTHSEFEDEWCSTEQPCESCRRHEAFKAWKMTEAAE